MIPQAAIRNALRKLWLWSPQRREAKKAARIAPGLYLCAMCQRAHREKEVDIDHVEAVGPTPGSKLGKERSWDDFMRRLFCHAEELRCLCKSCHKARREPAA